MARRQQRDPLTHGSTRTTARRQQYAPETLADAVDKVCTGESPTQVASLLRVPLSTLTKQVKLRRIGVDPEQARRGSLPLLTEEGEAHLVEWIKGMQFNGTPATRLDVMRRASEMASRLQGEPIAVSDGWYSRFMRHHPQLANREAQTIAMSRSKCSMDCLFVLFGILLKLVVEGRYDTKRVYNMDETSFLSRTKNTKAVALNGSQNVWSKSIPANFHLSVVACGSASGHVIPSLVILPGQRVPRNLMDCCSVAGARVTCTDSGFINRATFLRWVEMFSNSVPNSVPRSLLLLFDGYLSHLSGDLAEMGETLGIQFVCLPANATHLVQPLDIAVFSAFKKTIRAMVRTHMMDTDCSSVSKEAAVRMGSAAWTQSLLGKICVAGFRTAGLFPLSLPSMTRRLHLFKSGGAKRGHSKAVWLVHKSAMEIEILTLPAQQRAGPTKKRKTVDVAGRLLTREQLHDISETQTKRSRPQQTRTVDKSTLV